MIAVLDQLMEGAGVVRVSVFLRTGRRHFECQWRDPLTRKKLTRSTGTARGADAHRFAAQLEIELNAPGRMAWAEFRRRYEREVLSALSQGTRAKHRATFNAVETHASPGRLVDLDAAALSRLAAGLRESGLGDSTIRGHLDALRTCLKWAQTQGYLASVPAIRMPPKGTMRGRPVTPEEFERLQLHVARVVKRRDVRDYRDLQLGLWLSGLRLNEALNLHWDDDRFICVDLTSGRKPMFRIAEGADKSREARWFPMAPEFSEFLSSIPAERRRGFVFLQRRRRPSLNWVSKRFTAIGESARVKVADKGGKAKWASAHDLRRAFGLRWALRVMPPVLMALMRHHRIETTMRYYVGRDSDTAADAAWKAIESDGTEVANV